MSNKCVIITIISLSFIVFPCLAEENTDGIKSIRLVVPEKPWFKRSELIEYVTERYRPHGVEIVEGEINMDDGIMNEDAMIIVTSYKREDQFRTTYQAGIYWLEKDDNHPYLISDDTRYGISPSLKTLKEPLFINNLRKCRLVQKFKLPDIVKGFLTQTEALLPDGKHVVFSNSSESSDNTLMNMYIVRADETGVQAYTYTCRGTSVVISQSYLCTYGKYGLDVRELGGLPELGKKQEYFIGKQVSYACFLNDTLIALSEGKVFAIPLGDGPEQPKSISPKDKYIRWMADNGKNLIWMFESYKNEESGDVLVMKFKATGNPHVATSFPAKILGHSNSFAFGDDIAVGYVDNFDSLIFNDRKTNCDMYICTLNDKGHPNPVSVLKRMPYSEVKVYEDFVFALRNNMLSVLSVANKNNPVHITDIILGLPIPIQFENLATQANITSLAMSLRGGIKLAFDDDLITVLSCITKFSADKKLFDNLFDQTDTEYALQVIDMDKLRDATQKIKLNSTRSQEIINHAKKGDMTSVRILINAGINVNSKDEFGNTPLHMASYHGHTEIIKMLLGAKAELNSQTKEGNTPLHMALYKGHIEVVKILLEAGSDIDNVNIKGKTPLHIASYHGHTQIIKMLLDAKADVNARTKEGNTPLHTASYKGHVEIVTFLLEAGSDIDSVNLKSNTPLSFALQNGHNDIVKLLKDTKKGVKNKASVANKNYLASNLDNRIVIGVNKASLTKDRESKEKLTDLKAGTNVKILELHDKFAKVSVGQDQQGWVDRCELCNFSEFEKRKVAGNVPQVMFSIGYDNSYKTTAITDGAILKIENGNAIFEPGIGLLCEKSLKGRSILGGMTYKPNVIYLITSPGNFVELPIPPARKQ